MSKAVKLTSRQWSPILEELHKDYPMSVLAIRTKMRSVLGVTYRSEGYNHMVHLDFFSEPKRTMFLLKYSEFISKV